jgi:hypothetical protein
LRIEQCILKLIWIGEGAPQSSSQHGFEGHRFADSAAQEIAGARNQLIGIDGLWYERRLVWASVGVRCFGFWAFQFRSSFSWRCSGVTEIRRLNFKETNMLKSVGLALSF